MGAQYSTGTALLVVDMQNDFAHPRGSLFVAGGEAMAAAVNREIARARDAGALIVFSQDWHPPSTPHFASGGGTWPEHCVAGTWGAEFIDGLDASGDVIRKGTGGEDGYSAFSVRDPVTGRPGATRLDALLKQHGVSRVVIVGLATDYCVKETALDALRLGYRVAVIEELVRAVDLAPGDGSRALEAVREAGAILV